MFDPPFVDFTFEPGCLDLHGLPILIDENEHESIQIAVSNLADDLEKVTGHRPPIWTHVDRQPRVDGIILVGSLGKSKFIHELAGDSTGRVERIAGKWEVFHTSVQDCPWPCAKEMLVVTGSDKRGTIFGVYTLSEQIGVSPYDQNPSQPYQTFTDINTSSAGTGGQMSRFSDGNTFTRFKPLLVKENPASSTAAYSSTTRHLL